MHTTTESAARSHEHPFPTLERRMSQQHIPAPATGDDGPRHPVMLDLRRMRPSQLALPDTAIVPGPLVRPLNCGTPGISRYTGTASPRRYGPQSHHPVPGCSSASQQLTDQADQRHMGRLFTCSPLQQLRTLTGAAESHRRRDGLGMSVLQGMSGRAWRCARHVRVWLYPLPCTHAWLARITRSDRQR